MLRNISLVKLHIFWQVMPWLPTFGFSELCFSGRGNLKRTSISKTMAQVSWCLFCFSDILWFFNSCNIFIFYPETSYLRKLSLGTYFTFLPFQRRMMSSSFALLFWTDFHLFSNNSSIFHVFSLLSRAVLEQWKSEVPWNSWAALVRFMVSWHRNNGPIWLQEWKLSPQLPYLHS